MKKALTFLLITALFTALFTFHASASPDSADASIVSAEASEENDTESTGEAVAKEGTAVEKVFQVLFMVIMTVGIVGLPLHFWLNARKKNALNEYNESNEDEDEDEKE